MNKTLWSRAEPVSLGLSASGQPLRKRDWPAHEPFTTQTARLISHRVSRLWTKPCRIGTTTG